MTTVSTEAPRPLWREENDAVFRATIDAAAEQLDVLPLAVEKDYWVCQALRVIEEDHPGCVIFKGGTSLEKLRIIERFSEDLDLLVVESYSSRGAIERGLKAMCATAASAIPGCEPDRHESGGIPSAMHRSAHLALPSHPYTRRDGIADPDSVLLELGQSGGREPSSVQPVTTLLGRRLESAGVAVGGFADLAPFNVHILHPARTLIEKLLRVNNFAVDESRRENEEGWPRIGRQLYDIWALLGHPEVVQFLKDTNAASEVVKDCQQISLSFRPDHPVPTGGFSASDVFNMDWEHADRIRSEHDIAMSSLYYGSEPPTYEAVIARVRASAPLLNIGVSRR